MRSRSGPETNSKINKAYPLPPPRQVVGFQNNQSALHRSRKGTKLPKFPGRFYSWPLTLHPRDWRITGIRPREAHRGHTFLIFSRMLHAHCQRQYLCFSTLSQPAALPRPASLFRMFRGSGAPINKTPEEASRNKPFKPLGLAASGIIPIPFHVPRLGRQCSNNGKHIPTQTNQSSRGGVSKRHHHPLPDCLILPSSTPCTGH
jgi:hypothetical protein